MFSFVAAASDELLVPVALHITADHGAVEDIGQVLLQDCHPCIRQRSDISAHGRPRFVSRRW